MMRFLRLFVLFLWHPSRAFSSFPGRVDVTIIQMQQLVMAGTQQVREQVLCNGVSFTNSSVEVTGIIQSMSPDSLPLMLMTDKLMAVQKNHTILRSRDCILEGSDLHWTDRVFYDGQVYLTLDKNDDWSALVPQAMSLKVMWDNATLQTRNERVRLQEGCINLMKELRLSQQQPVPGIPLPQFLIPFLAVLVFTGLTIISLLLSKNCSLKQQGGVIGSVIHYPKDLAEMAPETKGFNYYAL